MNSRPRQTQLSWFADVAIVCPLEIEYSTLHRAFGQPTQNTDPFFPARHFLTSIGHDLRIVVAQAPDPGPGNINSCAIGSKVIDTYDPWLLVSFGIACSIDPEKVQIGDVAYARSIYYIDLRKETESTDPITKQLPQRITEREVLNLLETVRAEASSSECSIHNVVIVSSEAVVKSEHADRRKVVRQAVSDAQVLEMEAFGIYQACYIDRSGPCRRFCVAIKGISDFGNPRKSDQNQHRAACNAAAFLVQILDHPDLLKLRDQSKNCERPHPFRAFRVQPSTRIRQQVDKFVEIASPVLAKSVKAEGLIPAHLRVPRPRIFYHWRLTARGMHWVDLKIIRILQSYAKEGYPIECLITDEITPMAHVMLKGNEDLKKARQVCEAMVRALFPEIQNPITYLSEVKAREVTLSAFSIASGTGYEMVDEILKLSPRPLGNAKTLNYELALWFQYMAWRVRDEGTCAVILYWRFMNQYRLLQRFGDLFPALVPSADLRLGGKLGKFEFPGKDLVLVPSHHHAIMRWLGEASDRNLVMELWSHLSFQSSDRSTDFIKERQEWATGQKEKESYRFLLIPDDWLHEFVEGKRESINFWKGATAIELAKYNEEYFFNLQFEDGLP